MKKALLYFIIALVAVLFMVAGCDLGTDPPPDQTDIPSIIYSQHIQPIFARSCLSSGCHNAVDAEEDLVLESWETVFEGSHHGAMVIPFRPDKSHLVFHINTDSTLGPVAQPLMPPGEPLSRSEVELIMRWILEGARNDAGEVAFADPTAGKVYVTNQADDEVAVIDRATNLVMRMVPVGSLDNRSSPPEAPHNVVIDPQGEFFYVNLIVGNELWKYSTSNDTHVGRISLGSSASPAQVAITSDGKKAYVSNFDLGGSRRGIQVLDLEALAVVDSVYDPRLWATHGVQLTHDGKWLWTANQFSDNIAVIDTDKDSIVAIIKVDPTVPDGPPTGVPQFGPYQLVFTSDDNFAYVTCRISNDVRVFDTQTRQLVTAIPVGVNPLILDISPDDEFVYVANRGTGASPSKTVSVIRTSDNTEVLKIQDVGVEPHGVAVTPDGVWVYVTCENVNSPDTPHHPVTGLKTPGYVAVIDAATNQVVKQIEVGAFGAGIAILP